MAIDLQGPVFALTISLGACVPFLLMLWTFRRNLSSRREEIGRRLGLGDEGTETKLRRVVTALQKPFVRQHRVQLDRGEQVRLKDSYNRAYSRSEPAQQFDRYFRFSNYVAPLLMLVFSVIAIWLLTLVNGGLGDPFRLAPIAELLGPTSVVAGVAGYFWSLMELVDRARANDLPPSAVHALWIRMPMSMLLAPVVTAAMADELAFPAAIVVGLFPIRSITQFIMAKVPALSTKKVPEDGPTLHLLQGMTAGMQERMAEEGIQRVEHLAYKDPMKLLIRSNVDWELLADLIDQSLLVQHVGAKIADLRSLGVRGAIDMAVLYGYSEDSDAPARQKRSKVVLDAVAKKLGIPPEAAAHLGETLDEDPVVNFLWHQWGGGEEDASPRPSTSIKRLD
jgi:hypothetical protein